jgi:hypothetical protein
MSDLEPNAAAAAVRVMRKLNLEPADWQLDVLQGNHSRLLLNCCRQAGKSTVVAIHALLQAIYTSNLLVLLLSPSLRQSAELLHTVTNFYNRIGSPIRKRQSANELAFTNNSRIVSLPCKEQTIRGYSHVGLMIIDEAACVPDDLYLAARPMLAASRGRLICMSTPRGKRGFFYEAWTKHAADWHRIEIPVQKVAHISASDIEEERRVRSLENFRQEFECCFEMLKDLVYPDLHKCLIPQLPFPLEGAGGAALRLDRERFKHFGGIDFGYRNPFAALWSVLDQDGVLYLTGELYDRQKPLSHYAEILKSNRYREVIWYADPSGANEIAELRRADFKVLPARTNAIQTGISAVNARIQHGRLKIVAGRCPNLLAEAALYCYSDDALEKQSEKPVDRYNHALAALRYLIVSIDTNKLGRPPTAAPSPTKPKPKPWIRLDNEALWRTLGIIHR